MSVATVVYTVSVSSRERLASIRRPLRPRMNANEMPAISPVSSDGGADVMKIGLAIAGVPPAPKGGAGVGRPGSAGDGWTGMGAGLDAGAPRGTATGPPEDTESNCTARTHTATRA